MVVVVVVVGLMVKGLLNLWEAWPFGIGNVFVVRVEMVEASMFHYILVFWGLVSQTVVVAQRVRNLHHLKHIKDLKK